MNDTFSGARQSNPRDRRAAHGGEVSGSSLIDRLPQGTWLGLRSIIQKRVTYAIVGSKSCGPGFDTSVPSLHVDPRGREGRPFFVREASRLQPCNASVDWDQSTVQLRDRFELKILCSVRSEAALTASYPALDAVLSGDEQPTLMPRV